MNNKKLIPYGRQDISKSDLKAVQDVLKSDFLTTGPQVPKFERLFSNYVKADYATAVNSATSGLHIACMHWALLKAIYCGLVQSHSWLPLIAVCIAGRS